MIFFTLVAMSDIAYLIFISYTAANVLKLG